MTRISGYISSGEQSAGERVYDMLNNQTNGYTDLKSRSMMGLCDGKFWPDSVKNRSESCARLPDKRYNAAIGFSAQQGKGRKNSHVKIQKDRDEKWAAIYSGKVNDDVFSDLEREIRRYGNIGERIQNFVRGQGGCYLVYIDGTDGRMFAGASGKSKLVAGYDGNGWGVASDWGGLTQTKTNDYKVAKMMFIEDGVVELRPEKKTPRREIEVAPVPKTV